MAGLFKAGGTALVTGAAAGIGQATALAFAAEGCLQIAIGDVNTAGLEKTKQLVASRFPNVAFYADRLDVTDEASVENFHASVVSQFGRIDFVVNNAGYGHPAAPIHELSEEEWDVTVRVNQRGVFLCERSQLTQMLKQDVLPGLKNRGSIINVTSLCQTAPMNNYSAYSASKGGVLGISKCDAYDYGPDNIRVNCVAPGNTSTAMLEAAAGAEGLRFLAENTPLRRNATPNDIADAIVWLSSPKASFITGTTLTVDGGYNLRNGPP